VARHSVMVCDVCGRPTEQIAGKLCYVPSIPGVVRLTANNYSHGADIGVCCKDKVFNDINFTKRMSAAEHQAARRNRVGKSTVRASKKTPQAAES
jgi:hypothetical protein